MTIMKQAAFFYRKNVSTKVMFMRLVHCRETMLCYFLFFSHIVKSQNKCCHNSAKYAFNSEKKVLSLISFIKQGGAFYMHQFLCQFQVKYVCMGHLKETLEYIYDRTKQEIFVSEVTSKKVIQIQVCSKVASLAGTYK